MTIASTARKAGPLLGTGAQTSFPFAFKVFADGDLLVTRADALGLETALVLDTDYTVTLNPNQETSPGGAVVLLTAPAVGEKLTVTGSVDYDQPLDLPSGGNFSPLALENQLDRMTMQIQQLREVVGRTLRAPVTTSASTVLPAPQSSSLIGWNSNETALQNVPLSELATAVAFATYRYDTFTGDGTTTTFALDGDPVTLGNIDVSLDGLTSVPGVDHSLVGTTLVFTVAPTNGVEILARYGQGLSAGAVGDALDINYQPAGGTATTVQSKLRESVSVKDFGAVGDGVANEALSIQSAIAQGGGAYSIPAGNYVLGNTIYVDYSSLTFNSPYAASSRISLAGNSLHGTLFSYTGAASTAAIELIGPASFVSAGVYAIDHYEDFGLSDSDASKTRIGIKMTNRAYAEFKRLNVNSFLQGISLDSCLSSTFDNVAFNGNTIGMVLDNTTGQSYPNALSFEKCDWNGNVTQAIVANKIGATNRFTSCRIENNGRHGNAGEGGVFLNVYGANGTAALTFDTCYFENNGGGADLYITNTGSHSVTVVLKGCTFNRGSSSRFVTNNIILSNTGGGKIRCVLEGCSFFSTGTYVASASRPFLNYDASCEVIDIGCTYSETTSLGTTGASYPSSGTTYGGWCNGAGVALTASPGITYTRNSVGNYTVARAAGFGKDSYSFIPMAIANAPVGALHVQAVVGTGPGGFVISITDNAGTPTDCAFMWTVTRLA